MAKVKIDIRLDVQGSEFYFVLPQPCSSLTLSWRDTFDLGNVIGQNACCMPDYVAEFSEDEAEANKISITRLGSYQVVILFPEITQRLVWTRNVALLIADNLCKMSETIADEINKRGA